MKNKKGFTLVELLAILAILGIIATIAVINIGKQTELNESENKKILNQKIENAVKIYAAKYYPNKIISGSEFSFSIKDLVEDGVLQLGSNECSGKEGNKIKFDGSDFDYTSIESDNCYK